MARRRRRRLGVPLPDVRQLRAAAVVLGVLSAVAVVLVPVNATFAEDPILRLRSFDTASGGPATKVACGSAVSGLRPGSDPVTLYGIARDRACRSASEKRALTALAAGAITVLLGCLGLAASAGWTAEAR